MVEQTYCHDFKPYPQRPTSEYLVEILDELEQSPAIELSVQEKN